MQRKIFTFIHINRNFYIGLFLSFISTFIGLLVPLLIKNFIDLKQELNKNFNFIYIVLIFLLLEAIINAFGGFLINKEGDRQIANIRLKVQSHLLYLPIKYFDNNISGELSSRVLNDSAIIKNFFTNTVPQTILGLINILGSSIILFVLDWKLTILLLLIFPIDALVTIPIGKINEKITKESQTSISKLNGLTTESLRNIRALKLNYAEKNTLNQFKSRLFNLYKLSIKSDKVSSVTGPIQTLFAFILILGVILYGSFRISNGSLTIGTLITFIIYLFQIIQPINTVALFYSSYKQTLGATQKISSILNINLESNKGIKEISKASDIKLINATFGYDQKDVLKNISMNFHNGEKIAIVGPTGSGKSTIVNLITRLYPLKRGMLFLNNTDSKDISLNTWRKLFGVVSQENTMITGTVYDNIILGLDKIPSKNELSKAIKVSNLTQEINNLPNGINTIVGEQGVKLSGGQRQRIQIARAYLKKPTFLILDEATSNLDSDSERIISDALNKIMSGKTIISIAHRLSTIVDADKIYFIDDHVVKNSGNHYELLKTVPEYNRFVHEQIIKTKK